LAPLPFSGGATSRGTQKRDSNSNKAAAPAPRTPAAPMLAADHRAPSQSGGGVKPSAKISPPRQWIPGTRSRDRLGAIKMPSQVPYGLCARGFAGQHRCVTCGRYRRNKMNRPITAARIIKTLKNLTNVNRFGQSHCDQ